jgi:sirohydrochlorin cobaltochelatase
MSDWNEWNSGEGDRGLLVVGHGTRDPLGVEAFAQTVRQFSGLVPGLAVEPSFLEFARPTIAEGIERLAKRGVRKICWIPLFLFAAGHVRRDIPAAVAVAVASHPGVKTCEAPHLGCHPRLVELSVERCRESLRERPPLPPRETLLLLVGRGTDDEAALGEMGQFAELRRQAGSIDQVWVCFASMTDPLLDDILPRVARLPILRVVVQPHLLFPGYLANRISSTVGEFAKAHPAIDWVTTEPLGPNRLLSQAMVEILAENTCSKGS